VLIIVLTRTVRLWWVSATLYRLARHVGWVDRPLLLPPLVYSPALARYSFTAEWAEGWR